MANRRSSTSAAKVAETGPRRRAVEVFTVALFDIRESIWSRKFLVLMALYGLVVLVGTLLFLLVYDKFTEYIVRLMPSDSPAGPMAGGEVTSDALAKLVDDPETGSSLAQIPPLAIFHAWLGFHLVPLIVVFTGADCVAREVASGSSRYCLLRVPRLSWVLGKFVSQTTLMLIGISLAAVVAMATALLYAGPEQWIETSLWMARSSVRIAAFGFAFVGLTVGISQCTESNHIALASGLGARLVLWVLSFSFIVEAIPLGPPVMRLFLPDLHNSSTGLWHPELLVRMGSSGVLLAWGILAFALGFLVLRRRDA